MNRWLITGARGQLGTDLVAALNGEDVLGLGRDELDVTNLTAVRNVVRAVRPTIVVNTAGYTAVDAAESDPDAARLANSVGAGNVAAACADADALLLHISTDYVFDGRARTPYAEDAPTNPLSTYGRTKLAGEQVVAGSMARYYIVRTSWLYGANASNFVTTMLGLERSQDTVHVVNDQHGAPTLSEDLAVALRTLATSAAAYGVYHCTNGEHTTWFGLARAVFEEVGADVQRVVPVQTADFPRPALRPAYSVLGMSRWQAAGLPMLPTWRKALGRFLNDGRALTGRPVGGPAREQ